MGCQLICRHRGPVSWGRLGRYINCPHLCCNFRRRFFVSLAFTENRRRGMIITKSFFGESSSARGSRSSSKSTRKSQRPDISFFEDMIPYPYISRPKKRILYPITITTKKGYIVYTVYIYRVDHKVGQFFFLKSQIFKLCEYFALLIFFF
jgi:hypothetical protein